MAIPPLDGGGIVTISWNRPAVDLLHGPVTYYRVLQATSANGPFVEFETTTGESVTAQVSTMAGDTIIYYKVIAVNSAGESAN